MSDNHPELNGYEPYAEKPLRKPLFTWLLRAVVILAVLGLVLPGILTTVSVASSNAQRACAYRVAVADPQASGYIAKFEVFGPGGLGWECYSADSFDGAHHIDSMGLIPVAPSAAQVATLDS